MKMFADSAQYVRELLLNVIRYEKWNGYEVEKCCCTKLRFVYVNSSRSCLKTKYT